MKVGIVVDCDAESQALKLLTRRISIPNVQILDPLYADMQPKATPKQIVSKSLKTVRVLEANKVDLIIVLIDREDDSICPVNQAER